MLAGVAGAAADLPAAGAVEAGEVAADPGAGAACEFEEFAGVFFVFLLLLGVLESLWL